MVSPSTLVAQPGVVAEVVDHERHVGDARHRERLPVVERLELRELLGVLLDQVGELPDAAPTLGRRHAAPRSALEGLPRRLDGAIDVFGLTRRHLGERLFGRGVVGGERLPRRRLHPLPVDQHLPGPPANELPYARIDVRIIRLQSRLCHTFAPFHYAPSAWVSQGSSQKTAGNLSRLYSQDAIKKAEVVAGAGDETGPAARRDRANAEA